MRFSMSSVTDGYAKTCLPSRTLRLIFPTSAGGAGSFLRSVRRSGVAGSGRGGNDSPPEIRFCLATGGIWALGFWKSSARTVGMQLMHTARTIVAMRRLRVTAHLGYKTYGCAY